MYYCSFLDRSEPCFSSFSVLLCFGVRLVIYRLAQLLLVIPFRVFLAAVERRVTRVSRCGPESVSAVESMEWHPKSDARQTGA